MGQPYHNRGCLILILLFIGLPVGGSILIASLLSPWSIEGKGIGVLAGLIFFFCCVKFGNYVDRQNAEVGEHHRTRGQKQKRKPKWKRSVSGQPNVSIRYRNSKGEEKTFEGWRSSMEQAGNHINVVVAPDKVRIALNIDRILNRDALGKVPSNKSRDQEPQRTFNWQKPVSGNPDLSIRYRNWQGEEKTFEAWRSSMEQTGKHINVVVAPDKGRIALNIDRILNREVLKATQPGEGQATEEQPFDSVATTNSKEPSEKTRWTPIEGGKYWQKGWVFAHISQVSQPRTMVMRFGPREGETVIVPGKNKWLYSGVDPREKVCIEYTNFEGTAQTYSAILGSMRKVNAHLSFANAAGAGHFSLRYDRVNNQDKLPAIPTKQEFRKIIPHLRRGTTNATYERLKKQFPAFAPPLPNKSEKQILTYHENRGSTSTRYEELKARFSPSQAGQITVPELPVEPKPQQPEVLPEPEPQPEVTAQPSGNVDLVITNCGASSYEATKAVQLIRPDLGTFDIYSLLRDFPKTIAENVDPEKAATYKKQLEDAGCTVELK